jgi:hypothetical protein
LAEVASRTPAHTHVASIVLSALTKGMTGHDTTGLTTALEALLGELPSMVAHGLKKASKVMCIVMNIQCCLSLILCMCGLLLLGCTYFTQIEGGDPVGQKRPGAPGKRYKSMGEAKMGVNTARKCKVCGLKGHTSRSSKCPVRKQKKVNVDERQSSCNTDLMPRK